MRIYLAARYSRYQELQGYATELERAGHEVTSRWIQGNHQISDKELSEEAAEARRIQFAQEDLADLFKAELCISFTEVPRGSNSRGGRHVEFGIALGVGKPTYIVGHRENVFHCLPQVQFFPTWEQALGTLR